MAFAAWISGALSLSAASVDAREYARHSFSNETLTVHTTDGSMHFTFYPGASVEMVFHPDNEAPRLPSYALGQPSGDVSVTVRETDESIHAQTSDGLEVEIRKSPCRIAYLYKKRPLIEEKEGFADLGERKGFRFRVGEKEVFYGGGSRALGRMDRRGELLELYNRASYGYEYQARSMYYSMPAVVSSRKYMLVFDNSARGNLDIDSSGDGTLQFDAVGGRMAYLLIAADSWTELSARIADTTGHQPMLPRWALGTISSRMGYHTQEEVLSVVDGYIADDIPLDAIVLDLFWFGASIFGNMGNLDWDRSVFPEPEAMMADLRQKGVKTILITEPLICRDSSNWMDAVEKNVLATDAQGHPQTFAAFFGEAGLIDIFNPAARQWFWNFYRRHTASGVAGWWGDLGEPETHPDEICHAHGRGEELHNVYGHEWARLVHEGFRKDFPEQRHFNLMRAGFVGTQRYGILPWSGDVSRTWGGLKPQIELSLQMGLQGVAYMHSDLGGFTGSNRDPELYIRWMQYGVFQPIFRPHGHEEIAPEPIFWDETTKGIVRRYIELRYQLLPYNYTLMFENATSGLPLMRPLMFADDRPEMGHVLDAYLWGDALLISPVTEPGVKQQKVPLPSGTAWYDWWTGNRHEGGQTITVPITLENIPVFIKAGAFVPTISTIRHTGQYDPSIITVRMYADPTVKSSSGQMYDDDGKTPEAYTNKNHELLTFRSEWTGDQRLALFVEGVRHEYTGRPTRRTFQFTVHALPNKPETITVDGKEITIIETLYNEDSKQSATWNSQAEQLTIPLVWDGASRTINIEMP